MRGEVRREESGERKDLNLAVHDSVAVAATAGCEMQLVWGGGAAEGLDSLDDSAAASCQLYDLRSCLLRGRGICCLHDRYLFGRVCLY